MKKNAVSTLSALLCVLMLLSACGAPAGGSQSASQSAEPSVSALAPVSVPDPEPVFANPLTGEETSTDLSAQRPVAIMLNNLKKALPQLGVSQADLIYEAPAEGGITRMMAVFQSLDGVGNLGSVRSARPYYVEMAAGLDAIYIHAGGSDGAYASIKKLSVSNIDGVNGPHGGTMFWRDAARRKNAGFEHSLLTSGERIQALLSGKLSSMRQTHEAGYALPLSFTADGTPTAGNAAHTITLHWSNYKTGVFRYDTASGTYLVEEYGAPYVDGNTDTQVAVTNVLVIHTGVKNIPGDTDGRKDISLTGSGTGYFACGGKYIPIRWEKSSATAPFRFLTADGQPLSLGVGKSYINVADPSYPLTFE